MSIRSRKLNFKSRTPVRARSTNDDPDTTPSPRKRDYSARWTPKTTKEFYDVAMKYCSRRETSRAKMEMYLLRKAKNGARTLEESIKEATEAAIQEALDILVRQKVIDDERYAGMLVRDFQRRAKGQRYIQGKLKEKGLESQIKSIVNDAEQEFERALQVVEKLMIKTRFKKIENAFELKQKLTQNLMRAGFDLTLSKKAVALKIR